MGLPPIVRRPLVWMPPRMYGLFWDRVEAGDPEFIAFAQMYDVQERPLKADG